MLSRRRKATCQCPRSLPFSSTLLFLSIVLPTSSFAQLTDPASSTISSTPATFQTSVSSSSSPSSTSSTPASTTQPNPQNTPSNSPDDQVQDHVFNYYFLIIAIIAVLFCLCILYIGKRKKRKQALLRTQSQRALATDVAGFRARFGNRAARAGVGSYGAVAPRADRVEGLNERGEAPPPYVPGTKPPSLRSTDRVAVPVPGSEESGDVELGDMTRPVPPPQPPGYNEHAQDERANDGRFPPVIQRPATAVTANERYASTRGLLNRTDTSTSV